MSDIARSEAVVASEAIGYYGNVPTHIASADDNTALFVHDDRSVELRHRGAHVAWIYRP